MSFYPKIVTVIITQQTERLLYKTAVNCFEQFTFCRFLFKYLPESRFLEQKCQLMCGGPVDLKHGIVLHSDDYQVTDTKLLDNHLALTETQQILDDIANGKGPQHFLILIGKAAWEPGQLEEEFMANMWISTTSSFDLIFNTENEKKWQETLATLNIDANLLTAKAGKA